MSLFGVAFSIHPGTQCVGISPPLILQLNDFAVLI